MYIPKHFEQKDRNKAIAFMRAFNFALLVTAKNERPVAAHLPFVIEERGKDIVLVTHMSRANEQWKFLEGKVMVVFSEPHAYISPSLYEKKQNVPTWNYVAVHAYGNAVLLSEPSQQLDVLEKMMKLFEPAYLEQWNSLDKTYKEDLQKGIVAFEILVDELQSKAKLSQNKTPAERVNIIRHLEEGDKIKTDLAALMKDNS